jgi:hypothetical protein
METSPDRFKESYDELLLQFLWRQWSALGVSGYAKGEDPWVTDPEALLLFSTEIARLDSRLFDEILDWLVNNATWVSLQRLSRMCKEYEFGSRSVLAAVADFLAQESPNQKWKIIGNRQRSGTQPYDDTQAKPLFPGLDHFGEVDPIFLKWGWQRSPVRYRGLSVAPHTDQPAAFLIKLRSLFGRQSRAEIIAWLLANEAGHPAEIARQTSYYRRSVQIVLNELEVSGHVRSRRVGREKHFAIVHEQWRFLAEWNQQDALPFGFPQWIIWPAVFEILDRVHRVLNQPNFAAMSASLQAIEVRKAFDAPGLSGISLPQQFQPPVNLRGSAFLEAILDQFKAFLNPAARFQNTPQ